MVACELALGGVRPIVLDLLPEPGAEPKANGVVGQVIRMLDMRGLYREFASSPDPPQPIPGYIFSGIPVSFAELPANPMYALLIPQPRLVRLLEKHAFVELAAPWRDRVDTVIADAASLTAIAILIRPDGYLAWAAESCGPEGGDGLGTALARWFGPARRDAETAALV
jgi:hypothetical protein